MAKEVLGKTKIPKSGVVVLSLALCFCYLFSVSFQSMMFDEFHNETLVTLPVILLVYSLVRKKEVWYWISFIAFILTKEIFGVLGIPLGIYIWFTEKDIKKAVFSAALGLLTFYILIFRVMPSLSHSSAYQHFAYGNSPSYLSQKFENKSYLLVTNFFDSQAKQKTIFSGLLSFGFLPILSPVSLILPVGSLALRFYDDSTPRVWEFNNHYAAPFIPFMAIASIFGLYWLLTFLEKNKIKMNKVWLWLALILVAISLFQDVLFHGPINSLFKKQFYESQTWENDDYTLINQVPETAVISTQNSLLPHLSERNSFFLLPKIGNSQYIAVDLEDGPNKYAPLDHDQMKNLINNLILQKKFRVIWQKNQAMLLKRI